MQQQRNIPLSFKILRQLIVAGVLCLTFVAPTAAFAQAGGPTVVIGNIPEALNRAFDKVKDAVKTQLAGSISTYLINFLSYAADQAAYDAAVRLSSGGPGETPLVETRPWDTYLADVAAQSAGKSLDQLNEDITGPGGILKNFNLCAPGNANVLLSFKIGVKSVYQRPTPKCQVNEIVSNWKGFLADVSSEAGGDQARNQRILTQLADAFDPNVTEFSVGVSLSSNIINKSFSDQNLQLEKRLESKGYIDVANFITGNIDTPSEFIKKNSETALDAPKHISEQTGLALLTNTDVLLQVGLHAGSIFANTLLSKLTERVYTGLFDSSQRATSSNPFDFGAIGRSNSESARVSLTSIFTAQPVEITNYSILAEFGACPQANRGIYNCVADSSLISAVARASSGVPVTVQSAMEQGLLKAEWPLIPSGDHARNQDPFCYTYGYCSSNLVKLRKARVISVGWEFAADSAFNSPNDPVTLREVVAGFNDCNDGGKPDQDHPWCKLIDPNWVLKYPATQCRADVNGQVLAASASNERQDECVDMPSCIAEDENGNCTGGYGYCVREENVWQFRGQTCPKQFASCITVKNDEKTVSYLRNTTDPGPCTEDNAGCQWYVNNKTVDSTGAFSYPIIPSVTAADVAPDAYKNRTYFTGKVETCEAENGGCKELIVRNNDLSLNILVNPSFEQNTDNNNLPDGWSFSPTVGPTWNTSGTLSRSGASAVKTGSAIIYQPGVEFSQSRFYTVSFYARQETAGGTERGQVYVGFTADDASPVQIAGTSKVASANALSCDFADGNNDGRMDAIVLTGRPAGTSYERFSCTFTSPLQPNAAARIFSFVDVMPGKAWVDDLQIEQGPAATTFHEGYSSQAVTREVVKVAPTYLGCTGAATDPAECAGYAKVCGENDNGCSAYTPANGDPVVTGVTSELDFCPATCVGYDTYKQEATAYEPNGVFPLYFIPGTARTCTAQNVGCDEFTNLADESKSYFTYVRACVTPTQAQANISSDNAATFYTWEGSDNAGFQLKTWNLLESNQGPSPRTYAASGEVDSVPSDAPCSKFVSTPNGISCNDDYSWDVASCDEHSDIFADPTGNCREFYDANGVIHYRDWSKTVSVDASCATYRKTDVAGADQTERQGTCTSSGGFFDLASGICRYYGLATESRTCSAAANGCRSYTGGRSRNSRVAFENTIEEGSLSKWTAGSASTVTLSNESLATGGHSISASAPFATYVGDNGVICSSAGGCPTSSGALGGNCTVLNGQRFCGTLHGELFPGKTYTLTFLAKGSGTVQAGFDYESKSVAPAIDLPFGTVTVSGGWQQYSLGPLDMSSASALFGAGTALSFIPSGSVFVDNVVLREGQDNITLIKNSWVTPSVCDQTPTGTSAPQYYLGCQQYTTQAGSSVNLKSFSKLCAEDKVGCASFFMTQESTSPHAEVHNATCGTLDGSVATAATACYYGRTATAYDTNTPLLCTIGTGFNSCAFNLSWYVAPANLPSHLKYAPSTLFTPADKDVFLVVTDDVKCSNDAMGCTEYGKPTYNQARTATTGAESKFFKNLPSTYATTLCTQDALFCSQWTGTGGTQYYFKDPMNQTCEYKTNVTVGATAYDGWFKTGTSEFCYNTPPFIIGGNMSSIWKNGDAQYAGWVGTCTPQYDTCSEFQDALAVSTNEIYGNTDGTPYFSLAASLGSTRSSATGTACNGKVSLKGGCALFNDTSNSAKTSNASATEIASRHADTLFNAEPFSLVDPIDCDAGSAATTIHKPDGTDIDLCAKRCVYSKGTINDITDGVRAAAKLAIKASGGTQYTLDDMYIYGSSCSVATDCAPVTSEAGETVNASACSTVVVDVNPPRLPAVPRLKNDSNTVLAVNRNRQCSEWLSCADAQTVWDERTNSYRTVCGDIALCTEYSAQGSSSFCSKWNFENPKTVLTSERYTSRDVTWYGDEYSGFAIPNTFPVETLDQANVAPRFTCDLVGPHDNGNISAAAFAAKNGAGCNVDADCGSGSAYTGTCSGPQGNDFRLVLNAGKCTGAEGSACTVGTCSATGSSCTRQADCGSTGGNCVVGQCYTPSTTLCTSDADCTTAQTCSGGTCVTPGAKVVTDLTPNVSTPTLRVYNAASPNASCAFPTQQFVASVGMKSGSCVNQQCLLAPNGEAFASGTTEGKSCRAYPETTSPFTADIVETWLDTETQQKVPAGTDPTVDDLPYDTRSGFEHASFCAFGEDCLCSYKKVTYGEGGESRYYNQKFIPDGNGICTTGPRKGATCTTNDECADEQGNPGTCAKASREDVLLGLDGYCLERDNSINVNGNRDENACITWLPVDQLAGSSDLYGKSTEAGFFKDAYVCSNVRPFIDVRASHIPGNNNNNTIACAESTIACNSGTSFDTTRLSSCASQVKCPTGFYAIMGQCAENNNVSGFAKACKQTLDDDCPYVCVPYGAKKIDDGASCDPGGTLNHPPSWATGGIYTGQSGVAVYVVGDSDFTQGMPLFDAKAREVQACIAKGVELTSGNQANYTAFRKSTDANNDADANPDSGGYRSLRFYTLYAYPACQDVLKAASSADLMGYAWTDRIWQESTYTVSDSNAKFRFTEKTHPEPFGVTSIAPGERAQGSRPLVVGACSVGSSLTPPDKGTDLNACITTDNNTLEAVPESDPTLSEARSFSNFDLDRNDIANFPDSAFTTGSDTFNTVFTRINQLFAAVKLDSVRTLFTWRGGWGSTGGANLKYNSPAQLSSTYTSSAYDVRATSGNPPKIWAIEPSTCRGSECEEGPLNQITVNDQNSGDVSSSNFLRASVKFYAAADKNQLPLRSVVMDWGDDPSNLPPLVVDNFYKNHRGLQPGTTNSYCEKDTEWGMTGESCDPNYITYSHIYTCPSSLLLDASKSCATTGGQTPCVQNQGTADAACVYQPRVHTRDNWGWCTGVCTDGPTDGSPDCYDGDGELSQTTLFGAKLDECVYSSFPAANSDVDPWVYYDGQVIVKP